MVFLHPTKPGAYPAGIKADSTVMWYKKDGRNRKVFLSGVPLHYFHVADCGMDRGGIISRRYSRWRSTAEDDLCTAKLGLTNGKAPPEEREKRRENKRHQAIKTRDKTPANPRYSHCARRKTDHLSMDHLSMGHYWPRRPDTFTRKKLPKSYEQTGARFCTRNEDLMRLELSTVKLYFK